MNDDKIVELMTESGFYASIIFAIVLGIRISLFGHISDPGVSLTIVVPCSIK